jgi:transposase InsO family protein
MSHLFALTVAQRESIYREKLAGHSLSELAQKYHCSPSCVRRWWRVGRDHGVDGLHKPRDVRPRKGALSEFDPVVAEQALRLKRLHPKRGATRILHDLTTETALVGHTLPKRSSLAEFFHQRCPELLHSYHYQPAPPPQARHVHELWQMDGKEHVGLQDGTIATVLDVREPVACVFLGSFAHAVQTEKHWRKLTLRETQDDLRAVFIEFGLPIGVQTDRENLYGRPASEAFPTLFTLWLVGLGIQHHFSRPHQPTDQPQVERGHRTLFDWMAQPDPITNLVALQADLDTARYKHNAVLPSQAGDCQGDIPLQVHPEVLQVQRPYHPTAELSLFSLVRVDQFLSQFTWQYKVSAVGQIPIHDYQYGVGTPQAGKTIDVRFDPGTREFIFSDAQTTQEVKRHPVRGLDVSTITGLDTPIVLEYQPIQLSFAF